MDQVIFAVEFDTGVLARDAGKIQRDLVLFAAPDSQAVRLHGVAVQAFIRREHVHLVLVEIDRQRRRRAGRGWHGGVKDRAFWLFQAFMVKVQQLAGVFDARRELCGL